jgi:hypothetical protein
MAIDKPTRKHRPTILIRGRSPPVGERDLFGFGFSENVIFWKQYYSAPCSNLTLSSGSLIERIFARMRAERKSRRSWRLEILGGRSRVPGHAADILRRCPGRRLTLEYRLWRNSCRPRRVGRHKTAGVRAGNGTPHRDRACHRQCSRPCPGAVGFRRPPRRHWAPAGARQQSDPSRPGGERSASERRRRPGSAAHPRIKAPAAGDGRPPEHAGRAQPDLIAGCHLSERQCCGGGYGKG